MKNKDTDTRAPADRRSSPEQKEDGRATRSGKHPVGTGPEASHVIRADRADAPREREAGSPAGGNDSAENGSVTWSRDPSNPSASTGRAKPARMYADDEQEQSAKLVRRGVEDAQSDLARDARRAEFGKSTRKE